VHRGGRACPAAARQFPSLSVRAAPDSTLKHHCTILLDS
jgi:hypothetical protein